MADWREELGGIISNKARASRAQQENAIFEDFLDEVAIPALKNVADELTGKYGRETHVRRAPASATLNVRYDDNDEITFQVMKHFVQSGILPRAEVRLSRGQKLLKYTGMFKDDHPGILRTTLCDGEDGSTALFRELSFSDHLAG